MSALDQAIIKAYAKDRPATASTAASAATPRPPLPAGAQVRAQAVERIYHDGSLYRVEGLTKAVRGAADVPAPHLTTLPPTSPRRGVRRSMLKMLAASATPAERVPSVESQPRVARKVIIRHISHSAAPAPLGMLRPQRAGGEPLRAELPPELIPSQIPWSLPAEPATAAPLNVALEEVQAIEVRGDWDHQSAVAPMFLVADVDSSDANAVVVNVQLDCLDFEADRLAASADGEDHEDAFAAKSLDDAEEPRIQIRVDAPHLSGSHRPHARFTAIEDESTLAPNVDQQGDAAFVDASVEELRSNPLPVEELTFADLDVEALASDLIPSDTQTSVGTTHEKASEVASPGAKPAAPLWEVDRFQWPRTCEKLFADEQGYLARAGEKLLAAMQDGLKILAITGSRRGEGRTTLALCLARAAARAGIQVAVMDTDFARPQLASKVGLEVAYGWQAAALGQIPLSEAAVKSLADTITLLPLESAAATRSLSLADRRVTATIRAAAATFELLILDMGPLGAGDRIAFPPGEECAFDAAIVVRDLRFVGAAESEAVGQSLYDAGVEAVGIAENFVIDEEIPATSV